MHTVTNGEQHLMRISGSGPVPLESIRRILLIKWSALGDVVIASTAIQDVYDALPDCEIHLNTMRPWDRLFAEDSRLNDVFCVELRREERGLRGTRRWLNHVRSQRYDLVIDLQCNDHTRILLTLLGLGRGSIPYRVGYRRCYPYNIAPTPVSDCLHAHELAKAALQAAGIPPRTVRPMLRVPPARRRFAADLLASHGVNADTYAVFLPGCQAGGYLKRWGADRYAALARKLHASGLPHLVLLGGAEEQEECARIASGCGPWLKNLCGQTEIVDLVPICAGARFIVANDTGTAHVAAATMRPMVVICGPTDPRRVKPLGNQVSTLQADIPCINCYRKHCGHHSCMSLITPEMVCKRLSEAVNRPVSTRS